MTTKAADGEHDIAATVLVVNFSQRKHCRQILACLTATIFLMSCGSIFCFHETHHKTKVIYFERGFVAHTAVVS